MLLFRGEACAGWGAVTVPVFQPVPCRCFSHPKSSSTIFPFLDFLAHFCYSKKVDRFLKIVWLVFTGMGFLAEVGLPVVDFAKPCAWYSVPVATPVPGTRV